MSGSGGMSLQSANYYSPADAFFRGPTPLPSPQAPSSFESLFKSGELILPTPVAPNEWEGLWDKEASGHLADPKRDSAASTPSVQTR